MQTNHPPSKHGCEPDTLQGRDRELPVPSLPQPERIPMCRDCRPSRQLRPSPEPVSQVLHYRPEKRKGPASRPARSNRRLQPTGRAAPPPPFPAWPRSEPRSDRESVCDVENHKDNRARDSCSGLIRAARRHTRASAPSTFRLGSPKHTVRFHRRATINDRIWAAGPRSWSALRRSAHPTAASAALCRPSAAECSCCPHGPPSPPPRSNGEIAEPRPPCRREDSESSPLRQRA